MKQLVFLLLGTIIFFSCSETSDPADTDHEGLVEKQSHIITIEEARMDLESLLATLDAGTARGDLYPTRRIQGAYPIEFPDGTMGTRGSEDLESGEDGYFQYKLRMITGIRK